MSFWSQTHPSYDKYHILWEKHVPSIGECSNTTAEAFRLVNGVYYQLYNNGSWFGTSNYHAKLYEKQGLCSPADDFMYNLNMDYSDEYESDDDAREGFFEESYPEKCEKMDDLMGEVVEWAWEELADEADKKKLRGIARKKMQNPQEAEIREKKKRERESKKLLKEETEKLKDAYKIATGKRFRRKKGSTETPLETLRKMEVMYKGSMTLLKDILFTNRTPPKVTKNEFLQFRAIAEKQRTQNSPYDVPMPEWFTSDDGKKDEIMNRYSELEQYYL